MTIADIDHYLRNPADGQAECALLPAPAPFP
jgi:hypothetical protein